MDVIDSKTLSMMSARKSLCPDLIRAWDHPRIKSEDKLFGIMLGGIKRAGGTAWPSCDGNAAPCPAARTPSLKGSRLTVA